MRANYSRFWLVLAPIVLAGCAANGPIPTAAGAVDTQTFPTFTANPSGATDQIDEEERTARIATLEGRARQATAATPPAQSEVERLRRIAATHEAQAIREIERR